MNFRLSAVAEPEKVKQRSIVPKDEGLSENPGPKANWRKGLLRYVLIFQESVFFLKTDANTDFKTLEKAGFNFDASFFL